MSEPLSPPTRRARVIELLRSLARQLAAAVYAYVLFGLSMRWLRPTGYPAVLALETGLTFLVAAILSVIVAGPWWTSGLVGVFVAIFDVGLGVAAGEANAGWGPFAAAELVPVLAILVSGVAAALLVKRLQAARRAA